MALSKPALEKCALITMSIKTVFIPLTATDWPEIHVSNWSIFAFIWGYTKAKKVALVYNSPPLTVALHFKVLVIGSQPELEPIKFRIPQEMILVLKCMF